MAKELLSVKELAQDGVSVITTLRAYWKGYISGFKICKVLRIDLYCVLQVLKNNGLSKPGGGIPMRSDPIAHWAIGPRRNSPAPGRLFPPSSPGEKNKHQTTPWNSHSELVRKTGAGRSKALTRAI